MTYNYIAFISYLCKAKSGQKDMLEAFKLWDNEDFAKGLKAQGSSYS